MIYRKLKSILEVSELSDVDTLPVINRQTMESSKVLTIEFRIYLELSSPAMSFITGYIDNRNRKKSYKIVF